jgi:hypothetical protein
MDSMDVGFRYADGYTTYAQLARGIPHVVETHLKRIVLGKRCDVNFQSKPAAGRV